jgi:hypothetical protein
MFTNQRKIRLRHEPPTLEEFTPKHRPIYDLPNLFVV